MGIFDWFRRGRNADRPLRPGRQTAVVDNTYGTLSPYRSRTSNQLDTLRRIQDKAEAIEFLRHENPDVSMSIWNFIRLANLGHDMEFYGVGPRNKGKRLMDVEGRWTEFAASVNSISNSGYDGLIDQLHLSAFTRGAQGVEVEVASSLDDVVDVHVIKPQSVEWEYNKTLRVWEPFQWQGGKKVSLLNANFYWVPTDPDIDDPRGNLVMGSVLQAVDFQMQVLSDLQKVIHNQGWPRYDIELDLDRILNSMPAAIKADPQKYRDWINARVAEVQEALRGLEPDDSFAHTNDVKMNKMGANADKASVDARAVGEIVDMQLMSGAKQMGIFLNRIVGSTETFSTVQFRIFVQGIKSIQRGSKRLSEEIARIWLRTQGIQAEPKFTHHVIDWQAEEDRVRVKLMWQQFYAIAQLLGWISPDEAAQKGADAAEAYGKPSENIRASFAVTNGGEQSGYRDGPRNADESAERTLQKEGRVLRVIGGDYGKGGE